MMKQNRKALLLLCLLIATLVLTACGDVQGTYVRTTGETLSTTYVFSRWSNTVKVTERIGSEVFEAEYEYEIDEEKKRIYLYDADGTLIADPRFEQQEDLIKIDNIPHIKQ